MSALQSTHPARGATVSSKVPLGGIVVSIHAPRAGRDSNDLWIDKYRKRFNPRTPQGGRQARFFSNIQAQKLQSTHPSRGATQRSARRIIRGQFQSTHPSRGATRNHGRHHQDSECFNPRTPRGVRLARNTTNVATIEFQSTHPSRGATTHDDFLVLFERFNPRTPRGVRQRTKKH